MGFELFLFYLFGAGAPLSIFVINLSLSLLFVLSLWRMTRRRKDPGKEMLLFGAFVLAMFLSALFSGDVGGSFKGIRDWWALAAGFTAGVGLTAACRANLGKFQVFLAASSCLAAAMAVVQFVWGTDFHKQRLFSMKPAGTMNATGFFSHHLTFAGFMGIVLLFFAAYLLNGRRSPFMWAGAASSLACVLLSQSRGYIIALAAALPFVFLGRPRKFVAAWAMAIAAAAALMYAASPAGFKDRAASLLSMKSGSFAERVYLARSGAEMFLEKPLLGWGPGQYEKRCEPFKQPYADRVVYPEGPGFRTRCHVHNSFLMVLVESGALGLLCYLAFMASLALAAAGHRDPAARAAFLSMLAFFVIGGLFEYNLGDAEVVSLFSFMMGLSVSTRRDDVSPQ